MAISGGSISTDGTPAFYVGCDANQVKSFSNKTMTCTPLPPTARDIRLADVRVVRDRQELQYAQLVRGTNQGIAWAAEIDALVLGTVLAVLVLAYFFRIVAATSRTDEQ